MISACLTEEELNRTTFVPLQDRLYDDALWAASLRREIQTRSPEARSIALVGHRKDHSSYYLELFPDWTFLEVPEVQGLHATQLRKRFFDGDDLSGPELPEPVQAYLRAWATSPDFAGVAEEHRYLQQYRSAWAVAPYPVNFVTADAMVLKSGHVLLVERKRNPGQGLWALPGGFVNTDEPVLEAALRELDEETALDVPASELKDSLSEVVVFDRPDRSQRGRIITHLHCFRLKPGTLPLVHPQDDAAQAFWVPISEVHAQGHRFFDDHQDMIVHLTQRT
jgi:bifunctional NMN adenylyltransferase/nudix hydrolase